MSLDAIFGSSKAVVGMVHLEPLPGSPRWAGSMKAVTHAALADAHALAEGGVDAILVENFGDVPFVPGRVDPGCVAAMAAVATEIRRAVSLPLGINALRSDAVSALAIATAVGARFIRVNVHTGAVVTDQGILTSGAHDTLRYRRLLSAPVALFADVQTKTSDLERVRLAVPEVPLLVGSGASPENAADLLAFADCLIVGTSVKRDGVVTNR